MDILVQRGLPVRPHEAAGQTGGSDATGPQGKKMKGNK